MGTAARSHTIGRLVRRAARVSGTSSRWARPTTYAWCGVCLVHVQQNVKQIPGAGPSGAEQYFDLKAPIGS
jgi:hypothetical protein